MNRFFGARVLGIDEFPALTVLIFCYFLGFFCLSALGEFDLPFVQKVSGFYSVLKMDFADESCTYAFLKSMVDDGDLIFNNDLYYMKTALTQKGLVGATLHTVGLGSLWLPGYLVAKALTPIADYFYKKSFSYEQIPNNGHTFLYRFNTFFVGYFWGLIGLLASYFLFRHFLSPVMSLIFALVLLYGTPVFYFAFVRNRKQHIFEYALINLLLLILDRTVFKTSENVDLVRRAIYVLALLFLLVSINFSTLYFLALPLPFLALEREFRTRFRPHILTLSLIFLALAGGYLLPTFLASKILYGSANIFLTINGNVNEFNTEAVTDGILQKLWDFTSGLLNQPTNFVPSGNIFAKFYYLFFDSGWGLFFTNPILVLGLLFPFLLSWRDRRWEWSLFFPFILIPYFIEAGFKVGSLTFSHRFIIPAIPVIFYLGGNLLAGCHRKWRVAFLFFAGLTIFWHLFLHGQYLATLAYDDPQFLTKSLKMAVTLKNYEHLYHRGNASSFYFFNSPSPDKSYFHWLYFPGCAIIALFLAVTPLIFFRWRYGIFPFILVLLGTQLFWLGLTLLVFVFHPDLDRPEVRARVLFDSFVKAVNREDTKVSHYCFKELQDHFPESFEARYLACSRESIYQEVGIPKFTEMLERTASTPTDLRGSVHMIHSIRSALEGKTDQMIESAVNGYQLGDMLAPFFLKLVAKEGEKLNESIFQYFLHRYFSFYDSFCFMGYLRKMDYDKHFPATFTYKF